MSEWLVTLLLNFVFSEIQGEKLLVLTGVNNAWVFKIWYQKIDLYKPLGICKFELWYHGNPS